MSGLFLPTWSIPEAVVTIFVTAAWFISFFLKKLDQQEVAFMRSYQVMCATIMFLCGSLFLQHSGLVSARNAIWWTYFLGTFLVALSLRFEQNAKTVPIYPLEKAYWVFCGVAMLLLLLYPDWFVRGERLNSFGYPQAITTVLGIVIAGVHALAVISSTLIRFSFKNGYPGIARNHSYLIMFNWLLFPCVALLEQLNMTLQWSLPTVFWFGSLSFIFSFTTMIDFQHVLIQDTLKNTLEERDDLRDLVQFDDLTGLSSRKHAEAQFAKILEVQSACVLFIDLDDFKSWNDQYGHAIGDQVLRQTAQVLRSNVRTNDVVARYAGDEFFLVLPTANLFDGQRIAAAIETDLSNLAFVGIAKQALLASIGVIVATQGETTANALNRADLEAYQIKRSRKMLLV
jgi:diguanylate cyclase (GGDEF)-like protein